jgi:hypothetical protein
MQGDGKLENIRSGGNSVYVVISVCKRSNATPSISPQLYFFPANISVKDDVTVILHIPVCVKPSVCGIPCFPGKCKKVLVQKYKL